MVENNLLLKWAEAVAKRDLGIPIQVVGGLTMAQAAQLDARAVLDAELANTMWVVGGVLAAAGLVLFIIPSSPSVSVALAPNGAAVSGRF